MIENKKRLLPSLKFLSFLLSPILMVIFPILSFYLNNISELSLKFIEKPLLYSISIVIASSLLLFALSRKKNQSALLVSSFAFVFFSYGHLSKLLNSRLFIQLPNGFVFGPDKIFLPILFCLFIFLTIKIYITKKPLIKVITFLNIVLLVLVGYLTTAIAKNEWQKKSANSTQLTQTQVGYTYTSGNTPDIYYLILDGYAREDVLQEIYNYDNSEFIDSLKEMGFYTADLARSNYLHTYLSLPSTLNMRYLDELPKKYGLHPISDDAAKQLAAHNEVSQKLKNYGYTIINLSSTWEGTNENFQADITYKKDEYFKILGKNITLNESNITFLQTTLLYPLIKEVWGDALRSVTMTTLQKLPTIPYQQEKKFVLAHIMIPHPPYVFTAKGDPVPNAEFENADEGPDRRPKYLEQLIFISNQIIPIIQNIIQNSQKPPIIILQSDHGPASIFGRREDWLKNYSQKGIKERSSILYAVYFPDKDYQEFYETITPVNTFRILFNHYFDENLEILPDKTFYTSYEAIYDFKDVTEIK